MPEPRSRLNGLVLVTPCLDTEAPDVMNGTEGLDHIVGLDDDEIHGLADHDRLAGDGNFTVPGDD